MANLIDELRSGWQGSSRPSPSFALSFAASCLAVSTALRWSLSTIRSDVYFAPYIPAVFFATAFGGYRIGIATAGLGALLGMMLRFDDSPVDFAKFVLLAIFFVVCGFVIWGVQHYRSLASKQREISERLIQEREYRKLIVDELQHRLKNKVSTIHAVLHQVLHNQPQVWASIDQRMRSLSATDDLIAKADSRGCEITDLLLSELGPYGHVRFTLNGEKLFLPTKLAVSLALIFHELATNAGKYGAFSSARGFLQVSWSVTDDRLTIVWDETEGPPIGKIGEPGFGTKLLKSALKAFDGKTEITYLQSGLHCTMVCRIPPS
jgi:two-component sensor histidine kinase